MSRIQYSLLYPHIIRRISVAFVGATGAGSSHIRTLARLRFDVDPLRRLCGAKFPSLILRPDKTTLSVSFVRRSTVVLQDLWTGHEECFLCKNLQNQHPSTYQHTTSNIYYCVRILIASSHEFISPIFSDCPASWPKELVWGPNLVLRTIHWSASKAAGAAGMAR